MKLKKDELSKKNCNDSNFRGSSFYCNGISFFVLSLLLLFSCSTDVKNDSKTVDSPSTIEIVNPLDTILGDKMIDVKTGNIRPNNFHMLAKIPINVFYKPSKLYNIKKIDKDIFLVQQKKSYRDARLFYLLIKIGKYFSTNYYVINDFYVIDFQKVKDDLVLLLSNLGNYNAHWKVENEIKILKLSQDFNEEWTYSAKDKKICLDGEGMKEENGKILALVHLITGSHLCYDIVELEIDSYGNCVNTIERGNQHSSTTYKQSELNSIFKKKK